MVNGMLPLTFFYVVGHLVNGCLPVGPSFLSPKRKRKSATVSTRWTPNRAAALDPGCAAT